MTSLRHLVSIDDLSLAEMEGLFEKAHEFAEDSKAFSHLCRGRIAATLFYEPSTRTRLSFESAMLRLGGGVITAADMKVSSASKGESLADTIRVVGGCADVLIVRHRSDGAARLATEYSTVPVINAGDGAHEHPTQTLCDLSRHVTPSFTLASRLPLRVYCSYCSHEITFAAVGCSTTRNYHRALCAKLRASASSAPSAVAANPRPMPPSPRPSHDPPGRVCASAPGGAARRRSSARMGPISGRMTRLRSPLSPLQGRL